MTDFCPYCGTARYDVFRFKGLTLDTARRAIMIHGEPGPHLTPCEYTILKVLMRFPGTVFTFDQLLSACSSQGDRNTIKTLKHFLRHKIAGGGARIVNHHGIGYSLEAEERPAPAQRVAPRAAAMALTLVLGLLMAVPAAAHDPYRGYHVPGSGMSCCGGRDCAPGEYRVNPETGNEEVRRIGDDFWVPLDYERLVPSAELSGVHVCVNERRQRLLCVILELGS